MGACCSAPDGDTRSAVDPVAVDPAAEREQSLRKIEALRALLATTAAHVEPDCGSAIIPQITQWAGAQRAIAEAGEGHLELISSFESLIGIVGGESRTMAVLKSLNQAVVLQAVTFLFTKGGLLALTQGMLADVAGTWAVEIDLREAAGGDGPVRLTHRKTQGKPTQVASIDFCVALRLDPAASAAEHGNEDTGSLELADATLAVTALRTMPSVTPPDHAEALHEWRERVNAALSPSGDGERLGEEGVALAEAAAEWKRGLEQTWAGLEPRKGSTAVDIFRLAHVVSLRTPGGGA